MAMVAPTCPISHSNIPIFRGGNVPTMPGIPPATDLPSLIRTVNAITDVLRTLTTSLTVNNLYARSGSVKVKGDITYSEYPQWMQVRIDASRGYVFHRDQKTRTLDKSHRAYVQRANRVVFHNQMQEDPDFIWSYSKQLDQTETVFSFQGTD
jgi:hypothetical protein